MKRQIVNIVNFIRACEPRCETNLLMPVIEQIRLLKEYDLPGTFLVQYDAMIKEQFRSLLKSLDSRCEIGAWFEMNQPLIEKAGLEWRGRTGWAWDYHSNIGFSVGYTPVERKRIADVFMEDFKGIFGYYPSTVGSWFIDSYTLEYLYNKYKISSSCNCKDQWGTDGYTLWGGYYGQAYYPSKTNMFCPAQTISQQINVPIFRMLGSDPIYQYDAGASFSKPSDCQPVVTLEPAYSEDGGGGGDPNWVDWFFSENFNGQCLSFGYAQVGQENSFGWEKMKLGLTYQVETLSRLQKEGKLLVETMKQSGLWYRKTYPITPASSIVANKDWKLSGNRSAWYCCRNYRTNLFYDSNGFRIRDFVLFDQNYHERYLAARCESDAAHYDNLPLMDGNRWSGLGIVAGIFPIVKEPCKLLAPKFSTIGDDTLEASIPIGNGECIIRCDEEKISIMMNSKENWYLEFIWRRDCEVPFVRIDCNCIICNWNNHAYSLKINGGRFEEKYNGIRVIPETGVIQLIPSRI